MVFLLSSIFRFSLLAIKNTCLSYSSLVNPMVLREAHWLNPVFVDGIPISDGSEMTQTPTAEARLERTSRSMLS